MKINKPISRYYSKDIYNSFNIQDNIEKTLIECLKVNNHLAMRDIVKLLKNVYATEYIIQSLRKIPRIKREHYYSGNTKVKIYIYRLINENK